MGRPHHSGQVQIKPVYDIIVSFFLKTRSLGDEILEERLAAQVSILAKWKNGKLNTVSYSDIETGMCICF